MRKIKKMRDGQTEKAGGGRNDSRAHFSVLECLLDNQVSYGGIAAPQEEPGCPATLRGK